MPTPKLRQAEFEFDSHTVVFNPHSDMVLVFELDGTLIGEIPNPVRKHGGRKFKLRMSDALEAISQAVPQRLKLVASDEPKRKKTEYEYPPRLTCWNDP